MKKMLLGFGLFICSLFSVGAFAAVDAAVTTAIATGTTDTQTVAWLVVALIVGIAAIKYVRRAL